MPPPDGVTGQALTPSTGAAANFLEIREELRFQPFPHLAVNRKHHQVTIAAVPESVLPEAALFPEQFPVLARKSLKAGFRNEKSTLVLRAATIPLLRNPALATKG
jgi:hypothetical protein